MPIIPVYLGPTSWGGPNAGQFRPNGPLTYHGDPSTWDRATFLKNPVLHGGKTEGKKKGLWSARIFVGLNVGGAPRWTPDDVVKLVLEVRVAQVGRPDASFIVQRGLYSQGPDVIDETSVQVAIMNLPYWNVSKDAFKEQMVELADRLAEELDQESVILEIQKNGLLKFSWTIGPVAQ